MCSPTHARLCRGAGSRRHDSDPGAARHATPPRESQKEEDGHRRTDGRGRGTTYLTLSERLGRRCRRPSWHLWGNLDTATARIGQALRRMTTRLPSIPFKAGSHTVQGRQLYPSTMTATPFNDDSHTLQR